MKNLGIEFAGFIGTVLAVVGVVLNNFQNRLCFWFWIVSNIIFAVIHFQAKIKSLALRDLIFIVLAVVGLWQWSQF